ncbi:MAG: hypothetical protein AAGE43_00700 [Pseudomonadota bacterium]
MTNTRTPQTPASSTEEFLKLLERTEQAGINSLRKLRYFLLFAHNEGKSMAELAGRAKTRDYNEIQQAVIELSVGRHNANVAPELVQLGVQKTARPGSGRRKPIRLTPKGRRLYRRIDAFCGGAGGG